MHPVGKRDAEYVHEDNALQRAFSAKVSKHHEWLQAKNYWFVPVVAATSGALHPATLRLLYDFARLKTDAAELHAIANSIRSASTPEQLCQRRGATFARIPMRRSCTASSGPQLHGSLGSTGQRPTLPHSSLDPVHGPGVGLRLRPPLLPPACPRRACSVGFGLLCLVAFLPRFFLAPVARLFFRSAIFRLFVIKRIVSLCSPIGQRAALHQQQLAHAAA